ncbi:MAG: septal ring lytic transglycosylase RlpA family protein [Candidatus Peregrinibacteria bacterium]|nr:septal ring lytic transglycosylase RlpA family protein [Candidatus Peregrinibacteria bacterium]
MPIIASAAEGEISRREGFLQLWQSIQRPATSTREKPYDDVPAGSAGFTEITFAKYRGILDTTPSFEPDAKLTLRDALLWLYRTRSVAAIEDAQMVDLPVLLERYPLAHAENPATLDKSLTQEELTLLMQRLDTMLREEEHEVSLYAEKFHGKGTAFGETFDMHALTAAHRTFPHNTLVRVTNVSNGKSVTVRINDRGPFVEGRDMDLSLAAFTSIEERSKGKFMARFERLGDASVSRSCSVEKRMQQRITKSVRLDGGIPHTMPMGEVLTLRASVPFVVKSVIYPDGNSVRLQEWIHPGEHYTLTPSGEGEYRFRLGTAEGKSREMRMRVVACG